LGPAQKVVHAEKKSPFRLLCGLRAITLKSQKVVHAEKKSPFRLLCGLRAITLKSRKSLKGSSIP